MTLDMEKLVVKLDDRRKAELREMLTKYGYRYTFGDEITICAHCGFPLSLQLSRDQGLTKSCAFKEFRFEPPYVSKKKGRKKKMLPPIPEHMLPRIPDGLDDDEYDSHLPSVTLKFRSSENVQKKLLHLLHFWVHFLSINFKPIHIFSQNFASSIHVLDHILSR